MSEPSDTAPSRRSKHSRAKEESGGLGSSPGGEAAAQFRFRDGFAAGARRYAREWWRSSDVIGRRLRAIIDAATAAGSVGDEARTWASAAIQKGREGREGRYFTVQAIGGAERQLGGIARLLYEAQGVEGGFGGPL